MRNAQQLCTWMAKNYALPSFPRDSFQAKVLAPMYRGTWILPRVTQPPNIAGMLWTIPRLSSPEIDTELIFIS